MDKNTNTVSPPTGRAFAASLLGLALIIAAGCSAADLSVNTASSARSSAAPSQLADIPGFGVNPDADEARYNKEERLRGQMVVACMTARGFDYTHPAPDGPDENEVALSRQSAEHRATYYRALYGMDDPNDESISPEQVLTAGGCFGNAHRDLGGIFRTPPALADQKLALDESRDDLREAIYRACLERQNVSSEALAGDPRNASEGARKVSDQCRASVLRESSDQIRTLEAEFFIAHEAALVEFKDLRDREFEQARRQVGE